MSNTATTAWQTHVSRVRAFGYGVVSGWRQPYDLTTFRSVDDLPGVLWKIQEANASGRTWGQFLRGGRKSEPVLRGYPLIRTKNLDFKITRWRDQ